MSRSVKSYVTRKGRSARESRSTVGGSARAGSRPSSQRAARRSTGRTSLLTRVRDPRFWLSAKILIIVVVAWALFEGLLSQHSFIKLSSFRQQTEELRQQVAQAEAERADFKEKLRRLETDPYFLEKLAREKLGLVKEGEILYRYEEPAEEAENRGPVRTPIIDEGEAEEP